MVTNFTVTFLRAESLGFLHLALHHYGAALRLSLRAEQDGLVAGAVGPVERDVAAFAAVIP